VDGWHSGSRRLTSVGVTPGEARTASLGKGVHWRGRRQPCYFLAGEVADGIMDKVTQSPLARYREHLEKGELAYQFDHSTGTAVFHPRVIAPGSGSPDLEWRVSAGLGTVYATTVNHPRDSAPYNVALIDLDEGFRMMSRVEEMEPKDVKIGMRVKLRVNGRGEGATEPLPVFVSVEASR